MHINISPCESEEEKKIIKKILVLLVKVTRSKKNVTKKIFLLVKISRNKNIYFISL